MPKVNLEDVENSVEIEVKCPTCQKTRKVKMYWTGGNIKPRIRCGSCKPIVAKRSNGMKVYSEL